ncbi:MAG: cystathionine gamma-lyase [Geminicoccaceae bacterium]|nr:MAG: cystathionine gamma-lyase [Geminicoccaceae bacterium]
MDRPWSPGSTILDPADGDGESRASGTPFAPSPVFASTYRLAGDPHAVAMQYGRFANAGWQALERLLGRLEGGEAVVFPSGMAAAVACLNPFLAPGDVLLLPADGYYTIRIYATQWLAPWGVEVRTVATPEVEAADLAGVRLLWLETPSNPGLDCVDIGALVARARAAGTLVVVDNTTATPLGQTPLALGADLVVSADTKALNGHSDVLFGHVAARDPAHAERVRQWRTLTGSIPGPMETWLVQRGLMTLDVRLERMSTNALAVATWLRAHPKVAAVRYPGLPDDPAHAVALRQMQRFGCLLGVTFVDDATARAFLERSTLIQEATSFGGVHSTAEQRSRWGHDAVPARFVRLSVGIEPLADLLADMEAALG